MSGLAPPAADDVVLAEQLVPLLYADLRRAARRERRHVRAGDTLATTALVNEAYARLAGSGFNDRAHFLRVAAIAMHRILVERVRAQLAQKRGGGRQRVELDEDSVELQVEDDERIAAVEEALQRLAAQSPRLAGVVECRFFAGYGEQETAQAMGLSLRSVQRDWATARAWLQREIGA